MPDPGPPVPTIILGAAGRDFHNFNVVYRDDPSTKVVAFTASQIPGIAGRRYPPSLAGPLYADGIPIEDENRLEELCAAHGVRRVVFAYSDVTHEHVMHLASRALACGADFVLLGTQSTMLKARVPVVAVCAARTGAGKSPISRWLARRLRASHLRIAVVRHPMPYGDLAAQRCQRFATPADLRAASCTIEEREEYEAHIEAGATVFAGVDHADILAAAEAESDVIIWDGGNNDFPFFRPDLQVAVLDALRPGHASRYHPGEAVVRMADVVVVNKVNAASLEQITAADEEARDLNASAVLAHGAFDVTLDDTEAVRGRPVLVVEDGPTLTHGGMSTGAGFAAATAAGAEIVDPRGSAPLPLLELLASYPHIGPVLPAIGYDEAQVRWIVDTINASRAEVVVAGTPIDLAALEALRRPVVRARYEFKEVGGTALASAVDSFMASRWPAATTANR